MDSTAAVKAEGKKLKKFINTLKAPLVSVTLLNPTGGFGAMSFTTMNVKAEVAMAPYNPGPTRRRQKIGTNVFRALRSVTSKAIGLFKTAAGIIVPTSERRNHKITMPHIRATNLERPGATASSLSCVANNEAMKNVVIIRAMSGSEKANQNRILGLPILAFLVSKDPLKSVKMQK